MPVQNVKLPNKQKVKCSCNTSGCSRGQQTVSKKALWLFFFFLKTERRDDVAVFVNTLEECSLMLVHNWTTVPHPPAHTNPFVNISNTVIRSGYRAARKHPSTTRVCVCVCVCMCVPLSWLKMGQADKNTQGGEGEGAFKEGRSYIAWKKPSTSVHECTFIQDNPRVPSGERKHN